MAWLGHLLRNRRAGEHSLTWNTDGLDAPATIRLSSPAFADGSPIPQRHAGRPVGGNVSPAIAWTGIPDGARELVLIVEDPDVPFRTPIVHATARLSPGTTALAEGALNAGGPHGDGRGSFGRAGYHGPRPIPGHGPHAYVFQLYALDRPIPGDASLRPATIVAAMAGHVIARGRLTGTYER
jgi:Raf kinase inhibitor-like YbhB/YbcL family protein